MKRNDLRIKLLQLESAMAEANLRNNEDLQNGAFDDGTSIMNDNLNATDFVRDTATSRFDHRKPPKSYHNEDVKPVSKPPAEPSKIHSEDEAPREPSVDSHGSDLISDNEDQREAFGHDVGVHSKNESQPMEQPDAPKNGSTHPDPLRATVLDDLNTKDHINQANDEDVNARTKESPAVHKPVQKAFSQEQNTNATFKRPVELAGSTEDHAIHRAFVLTFRTGVGWKCWDMPISTGEVDDIVESFQKKKKVVLDSCMRLNFDQFEQLQKKIKSCEASDDPILASRSWSFAALRILPKRARFKDISSVQFVLKGVKDSRLAAQKGKKAQQAAKRHRSQDKKPRGQQRTQNVVLPQTAEPPSLTEEHLKKQQTDLDTAQSRLAGVERGRKEQGARNRNKEIPEPIVEVLQPSAGPAQKSQHREEAVRKTVDPAIENIAEIPQSTSPERPLAGKKKKWKQDEKPDPWSFWGKPTSQELENAGENVRTDTEKVGEMHAERPTRAISPSASAVVLHRSNKISPGPTKGLYKSQEAKQKARKYGLMRTKDKDVRRTYVEVTSDPTNPRRGDRKRVIDQEMYTGIQPGFQPAFPPQASFYQQAYPFVYANQYGFPQSQSGYAQPGFPQPAPLNQYLAPPIPAQNIKMPNWWASGQSGRFDTDDDEDEDENEDIDDFHERGRFYTNEEDLSQYMEERNAAPRRPQKTREEHRERDKDLESLFSGVSGHSSLPGAKMDHDVAQYIRQYANIDVETQAGDSDNDYDRDEADRGRQVRR